MYIQCIINVYLNCIHVAKSIKFLWNMYSSFVKSWKNLALVAWRYIQILGMHKKCFDIGILTPTIQPHHSSLSAKSLILSKALVLIVSKNESCYCVLSKLVRPWLIFSRSISWRRKLFKNSFVDNSHVFDLNYWTTCI